MNEVKKLIELEERGWRALSSGGNAATEFYGALLADDAVIYKAIAQRSGSDVYRAMISSIYVLTKGEWKLVFHQQSPI